MSIIATNPDAKRGARLWESRAAYRSARWGMG